MEACLTRFCRQHLAQVLSRGNGLGTQVLLRGLPGTRPITTAHAVQSADWYHPIVAEILTADIPLADGGQRHARLAQQRAAAEQTCRAALVGRPRLLTQFDELLQVNQRYAVIREEQARDFTRVAHPAGCLRRLGEHMVATGAIEQADDVFFCNHEEVTSTLRAVTSEPIVHLVNERRHLWQRQRSLAAPLTLGQPVRLIGDVIGRAVQEACGEREVAENVIGHPASAGRATGPVRIVQARKTSAGSATAMCLSRKPPLRHGRLCSPRAAAVITDSGTLAAHASLVAREYGIPAVVATGDATVRLHPGQLVTVDGSAGTITPHTKPIGDQRDGQRVELTAHTSQGQMSTLVLNLHRTPCDRFKISTQRIVQEPEASSTAITVAGGCASHRSSQRRCLAWPCRQQFLDAFYAGQAHRGCSASWAAAR